MRTQSRPSPAPWKRLAQEWRAQFSGLDPHDPARWPKLPRLLLLAVLALAMFGALWLLLLGDLRGQLQAERQRETDLRAGFSSKLAQAANLDALRTQLVEVRLFVQQLERQLPSRSEMDALLADINQAGLARGLEIGLFRPGAVVLHEHYAELPIALRVSGGYHDMGHFVADLAHLSRIVTLHELTLTPVAQQPDRLTLEATARTFRYLDPDEVAQQQQQQRQRHAAREPRR